MRKIVFCCAFILFALVACQTTTKGDIGQYKGSIEAITTPIVMRYRPYPQSTFKKSQETYIIKDRQKKLVGTTNLSGNISAKSSGSDVILNIKLDDRKTKMSGNMKLICTDRGKFKDFEIEFPDLDLNPSELKILNENFKTALQSMLRGYPEKGVMDGDSLFNIDYDIGQLFRGLIPEIVNIPFSTSATVRGITKYRNRQTLVMDIVGNVYCFKFETSEIPMSTNLNGYSLVDVDSGALVYEEILMDLVFEMKERASIIQIREINQIDLK